MAEMAFLDAVFGQLRNNAFKAFVIATCSDVLSRRS